MIDRTNPTPLRREPNPALTAHERRRLAVEAAVHPATVERYLAGAPVRSTCRSHIERALVALGRPDLVRIG